jgi:hypothetical protein
MPNKIGGDEPPPRFCVQHRTALRERRLRSTVSVGGGRSPLAFGHMARMVILIFIFLTATSGAYFTSIGCRQEFVKHRRPGWHLTLLGVCITTLLTALFVGQEDLFRPDRWDSGKVGMLPVIIITLTAAAVSLIASLIMVLIFRGRFRDEKHLAEPTGCSEPRDSASVSGRASVARGH